MSSPKKPPAAQTGAERMAAQRARAASAGGKQITVVLDAPHAAALDKVMQRTALNQADAVRHALRFAASGGRKA